MSNHNEISSFIWNVCDDVLRGLFKQHEYGGNVDRKFRSFSYFVV